MAILGVCPIDFLCKPLLLPEFSKSLPSVEIKRGLLSAFLTEIAPHVKFLLGGLQVNHFGN